MNGIQFVSASKQAALMRLEQFVNKARIANPFPNAIWAEERWPLRKKNRGSSSVQDRLVYLRFPDATGLTSRMDEEFGDFLRAVNVNQELRKSKGYSTSAHQGIVRAGRYLHEVLHDRGVGIVDIRPADFDLALSTCQSQEKASSVMSVGRDLNIIVRTINDFSLSATKVQWRSSAKTPQMPTVGADADVRRDAKMPSQAVLDAIAGLSNVGDLDDRDLLRQRGIDLLACAGFRMNELLTLHRDTLVEEIVVGLNGEQMTDSNGNPAVRTGLRYWPEKGGQPVVKWLPTIMQDIAKRALKDIGRITEPYAKIAKYMHENPGRAVFGEPWDSMEPTDIVAIHQVAEMFGLFGTDANKRSASALQFIKVHGIQKVPYLKTTHPKHRKKPVKLMTNGVLKADLDAVAIRRSKLGNQLGDSGVLLLHECLFVVPIGFFRTKMDRGIIGSVELMNEQHLHTYLAGKPASRSSGAIASIFERLDLRDAGGEYLRANSHQFRHWLTTLALEGGLGEHEVARWAGRKQIQHNANYDHSNPRERAKSVAALFGENKVIGPLADVISRINDPVRKEELIQRVSETIHVTDLGLCTHDWTALSCGAFGICATCFKLLIVKGEAASHARARGLRQIVGLAVEIAREEDSSGTLGADNWLASHEAQLRNLDAILAVHENPDLADGTLVQLTQHGWTVIDGNRKGEAA